MHIKKLIAKNFLSWEHLEFDFQSGITLISGWNYDDNKAEGSGKSAVLNALCYGLYGRLPKQATTDQIIMCNKHSAEIRVHIDDYIIVRTKNPSKLYILDAKTNQAQMESDVKTMQREIIKRLGITYKTFISAIYFPQDSQYSFIRMAEEDKAKMLSDLLNLEQFTEAFNIVTINLRELAAKRSSLETQINSLHEQFKAYDHNFKSTQQLYQTRKTETQDKIKAIKEKLANAKQANFERIEAELKEAEEQLNKISEEERALFLKQVEYKKVQTTIESLKHTIHIATTKIQEYTDQLSKLTSSAKPTCPLCGSILHKTENKQAALDDYNKKIKQLTEERAAATEQLKTLKTDGLAEVTKQLENYAVRLKNIKEHIANLKAQLKAKEQYSNLEHELKLLEEMTFTDFEQQLRNITAQKRQCTIQLQSVQQELASVKEIHQYLEQVKVGFKEVKKLLYIGFLNELNYLTNEYASKLFNVPVQVFFTNIDEEGELSKIETKVLLDNKETILSGGQFKRIELATFLGINAIINQRLKNIEPIRILDEVMTNLSTDSATKVVELLRQLPGTTVIVEHNEFIKSIIDRNFKVEYKKGVSKGAKI